MDPTLISNRSLLLNIEKYGKIIKNIFEFFFNLVYKFLKI